MQLLDIVEIVWSVENIYFRKRSYGNIISRSHFLLPMFDIDSPFISDFINKRCSYFVHFSRHHTPNQSRFGTQFK